MKLRMLLVVFLVLNWCGEAKSEDGWTKAIKLPHGPTVADIKEGETVCTSIFVAQDGSTVLLSRRQALKLCMPWSDKITLRGGKYYGKFGHPLRGSSKLGYATVMFDMVPVLTQGAPK